VVAAWFILSAIGRDRPGLVADLAQLIYDCDANLEDSRMTILGTEFAVILLCSSTSPGAADRLVAGAKRLEREQGLTILMREVSEGRRPALPAPGTALHRLRVAGEDRAGIVASVCRALAEYGINIADLATRSVPGPGGSPHYEMTISLEVPERADLAALRGSLESVADRLVIDVSLERI
jgi:glycine cleavage system transcriptional repressor